MQIIGAGCGCRLQMKIMDKGCGCRLEVQIVDEDCGCRLWMKIVCASSHFAAETTSRWTLTWSHSQSRKKIKITDH